MSEDNPIPDPDLTLEQAGKAAMLSEAELNEIDQALLNNACNFWKKVARIVGSTMNELPNRPAGIPDTFYAQRVRKLVEAGKLEFQGDLSRMRFSEVRIPD